MFYDKFCYEYYNNPFYFYNLYVICMLPKFAPQMVLIGYISVRMPFNQQCNSDEENGSTQQLYFIPLGVRLSMWAKWEVVLNSKLFPLARYNKHLFLQPNSHYPPPIYVSTLTEKRRMPYLFLESQFYGYMLYVSTKRPKASEPRQQSEDQQLYQYSD